MSSVVISGDTSGSISLTVPAVAGTYTNTLPQITGTLSTLDSGTAVASTSGTSIDFTGIPANVRRITVMFNGVSTNGTSNYLIKLGSGSVTTSGYSSSSVFSYAATPAAVSSTSGFIVFSNNAGFIQSGAMTLVLVGSNNWVSSHQFGNVPVTVSSSAGGGNLALGGTLDRIRITTVNGTDTFDAGSINILYE